MQPEDMEQMELATATLQRADGVGLAGLAEQITELARTSAAPQTIDNRDRREVVVAIDGKIERVAVPPPVRDHEAGTLADLATFALHQIASGRAGPAVVWHNPAAIVAILDDTDRRDRITFLLSPSRPFVKLAELERTGPLLQVAELVRMLRFLFGVSPDVLGRFRRLDWDKTDRQTDRAEHGRESLGRDITARVEGVEEIPEELTVSVPLYDNAGERDPYEIRLGVDLDPVNRGVRLVPMPGELQRVSDTHQATIAYRLAALSLADNKVGDFAVFFGAPEPQVLRPLGE